MSDDILKIREFHVKDVVFGDGYSFKDSVLTIPQSVKFDLPKEILSINIRIIKKDNRHLKVNSIMDIIPISTKVSGKKRLEVAIIAGSTAVLIIVITSSNLAEAPHAEKRQMFSWFVCQVDHTDASYQTW